MVEPYGQPVGGMAPVIPRMAGATLSGVGWITLARAGSGAGGVAIERLVFAPRLPNAQHLARYRVADLALDTFPYTSHTTLSDALWCGCPAVGLCGRTFASRVSGSLLTTAGLPDLITEDLAAYERLALRLATEPDYREAIRARVLQARDASPLFDSLGFTRDLERLYLSVAGVAPS